MASSLTAAICGLEDLLIASATFRSSIPLATDQEVRDKRIFLEALTDEQDNLIPDKLPAAAIVETEHQWSPLSRGPGLNTGAGGSINLLLARTPEHEREPKRSRLEFCTWSSQIIDEIMQLVAEGDHYEFSGVTLSQRATRPPLQDQTQDYWWCSYDFRFSFDE